MWLQLKQEDAPVYLGWMYIQVNHIDWIRPAEDGGSCLSLSGGSRTILVEESTREIREELARRDTVLAIEVLVVGLVVLCCLVLT